MTAKRFTIEKKGGLFYIFDTGNLIKVSDGQPICDLLNEQHEQIQDLKTMNKFLDTENNQIHNELKTRTQIQHKLEEENEQLKQQEMKLYTYFKKYFDNISEESFKESWELIKDKGDVE